VTTGMGWYASGGNGAIVAGGSQAVASGIRMLAGGGNAADAAVATLLSLGVTDYGYFCIGAEAPLIVYDARRGETKVLCGLGTAPRDPAAMEWYYANGIPAQGGMAAAAVPGAVSLCFAALAGYGTMTFAEVCAPVLVLLDAERERWHGNLAATLRRLVETEGRTAGTREEKLRAARNRFYRGDIADELVEWYAREGGFLGKADLAEHETRVEDPVCTMYRGYTVCKCDTWTQGPSLCQALRLLEGFDLCDMGHLSADYIHVCVEALKLAFADRDEYYGDPLFTAVPLRQLLSDEYTELRRSLIDMGSASTEARPGAPVAMRALKGPGTIDRVPGGTTTCCVADRWGNVVSVTPSGNPPYVEPPGGVTGVAHGNRLRSLNTMEGHPNSIQPGKRPRITLTPTMILKDGRPAAAISVAGGDLQEQATLNLLLNFVDFGMLPADAVTKARFCTSHHQDSFNPDPCRPTAFGDPASVTVNDGVSAEDRHKLAGRGHSVAVTAGAIAAPAMLCIDAGTGTIHVAGDPAAGRHAAAL
jgi:gamma-glutamyltranspeptidase/glutathione hydrolase